MPEAATSAQTELIAVLALADGALFYGRPFGAVDALDGGRRGEVVFATAMTGYQEICTDPSYRGQMVVLTYPLVGNYGIALEDMESRRPWLSALLVRECCEEYSHWRARESLAAYLARCGIPGICELDTRALTRHLRTHGTQRGVLRAYPASALPDRAVLAERLVAEAQRVRWVSELGVVREVALGAVRRWEPPTTLASSTRGARQGRARRPRVVLIDTGYKENIARCLHARDMQVVLAPPEIELPRLMALRPDGVLLANGPGDPETQAALVTLVRGVLGQRSPLPLMGICLGHQILGLAAGATTSRLPFGHHGANHPVLERRTGKVTITSQNHNFQVDATSLPPESGFMVSHVNLSDGSVEGLEHESLPIFSVQYHPEACPGPQENRALFDRFKELIEGAMRARESSARLVG